MAKKEIVEVQCNNAIVPLHIVSEYRSNIRISIAKSYAKITMPNVLTRNTKLNHIKRAIDWVKNTVSNDPRLYKRFEIKSYASGDTLVYFGNTYTLELNHDCDINKGSIQYNKIRLCIPKGQSRITEQNACKTLLSKLLAKSVRPQFECLVHKINSSHFNQGINSIKLKYNKSNWGSCSGKGNLNFSTRLLFAPQSVIEYVIIHELSHLIEMNHSSRFWDIVAKACPNYKIEDNWLKINGHLCDF